MQAALDRFKIQDFIRQILNYIEYNQQWNVSQVKSAQWTVQLNVTQHKRIYINIGRNKKEE